MYRDLQTPFKAKLGTAALTLALVIFLGTPLLAWADTHYVSMSKIFPDGKCSAVAPNFELMKAEFAGGELTQHKIHDGQGELVETITTFINKQRDQWAIVGSKRDEKVIFCLYASGIGTASVDRQTIGSE